MSASNLTIDQLAAYYGVDRGTTARWVIAHGRTCWPGSTPT
ncbi:MAG: hypothetical protein ACKV2T_21580 [Kofleriaceae bacterium]